MSKNTPRSIHNLKWLISKNGLYDSISIDILNDKYQHLYHFNDNDNFKKPEERVKYFIHNNSFLSDIFYKLIKIA